MRVAKTVINLKRGTILSSLQAEGQRIRNTTSSLLLEITVV